MSSSSTKVMNQNTKKVPPLAQPGTISGNEVKDNTETTINEEKIAHESKSFNPAPGNVIQDQVVQKDAENALRQRHSDSIRNTNSNNSPVSESARKTSVTFHNQTNPTSTRKNSYGSEKGRGY